MPERQDRDVGGCAKRLKCVFGAVILLCLAAPALSDPTLGTSDWDANYDAWTNYYGWTDIATPATGGNTGGWLRVTFTETGFEPPDEWSETVYMTASNLYAGTWDTTMFIAFDFWQSNMVAGAIQVQWRSTNLDSDVWIYSLTPQTNINGWVTYTAPFADWSDWAYPFAEEEQYLLDLQAIDWIGVYIYRNTTDEQIYGIDNFSLMVPEPAECFMLAAAAVTSAMSLRRKRRKNRVGDSGS